MLFRLRNAAALALLALLAAAAPGTTEAHHHDKGLRGVVATDADKAAADDATKALTVRFFSPPAGRVDGGMGRGCGSCGGVLWSGGPPNPLPTLHTNHHTTPAHKPQVTYPNPELHTNVWEDKRQGKWFSQTQVFLTNTAAKAICDVKVRACGCVRVLWVV